MTGYERSDVGPRQVWLLFAAVAGLVGVAMLAVGLFVRAVGGAPRGAEPMPEGSSAPPGIAADRRAVEGLEEKLEAPAEWIDREEGIVRIPIGLAMEKVVAEQGAPSGEHRR